MTKKELRSHFRNIRQDAVSKLEKSEVIEAISRAGSHLEEGLELPKTIAGYAGFGAEIDTLPLLANWLERDKRIALPAFADRTAPMEFREWTGAFETGPLMDIPQPPAGSPLVDPDLILVPLTAVDLAGNRIGQGAGHYDRKLTELAERKAFTTVGFAWECQIADAIPADPWDVPLDFILTPDRLIEVAS